MRWNGLEKYVRIDQVISKAAGERIVIIDESASGSMALTVYSGYIVHIAKRQIKAGGT